MSKRTEKNVARPAIDLEALGIELPDDIKATIADTPVEALRRRLPYLNDELTRTEDLESGESAGHLVRLVDWDNNIKSKKKGGNRFFEKIDVEMVEPNMTFVPQGREAEVSPGTRFTILMERGDEAKDNRARKVRVGMIHAVAASATGAVIHDGKEALQVAFTAIQALKQGKLTDDQPLLMRAHVRYSRNNGDRMKPVDINPSVRDTFGEMIKVQPGDPNRGQYGQFFYNVELDVA